MKVRINNDVLNWSSEHNNITFDVIEDNNNKNFYIITKSEHNFKNINSRYKNYLKNSILYISKKNSIDIRLERLEKLQRIINED